MDMKKYKDDKIILIKDDLMKMRARPTYIIGHLGELGVLHLCKEIIDNNRDECYKQESPGNTVDIEIHDDYIISRDNGRGIDPYQLREVHETNQGGSNMTRSGGMTAGENGTGTTAYTALAADLTVTTLRPQNKTKLTLVYHEGVLVDEIWDKNYTGEDHGLITMFKPSKKILGTNKIPTELLHTWLKDFDYTLPNKIKMNYSINGTQYSVKHKSLFEYFDETLKDAKMSESIVVNAEGKLKETVQEKIYDRTFRVEASFVYSTPEYNNEAIRKSWMNMIYTSQNGMHVNGAINGFVKYMTEKIYQKKKNLEGEDLKRDILSNLQVIVKAECDFANMFDSQAKSHVFPKVFLNAFSEAVYNGMEEASATTINMLIDIILSNRRVRIEGEKVRHVSSQTKAFKSWVVPDSYIPCSSAKTKEPKELYLVEGLSAGGGLHGARYAKFQAILQFRGKSLNVWDEDLTRILDPNRPTWLNLVRILGCGIGPTFDIKKLNFARIIIATDADIDGFHIRVLNCAFFLKYMKPIIENGLLYIAEPPLYKLAKGKDVTYVASQTEYIQKCIHSISDLEISFPERDI